MISKQLTYFYGMVVPSAITLLMAVGLPARAATSWDAGGSPDNSWFNADNWNNGVPDITQTVTINNAVYQAVIDTADATSLAFTLTSGSLTIEPGRTWSVNQNSGSSTIGSGFTLNINGGILNGATPVNGSMNINGGTINIYGGGSISTPIPEVAYYQYFNSGTINLGDQTSSGTYRASRSRNDSNSTYRGWGSIQFGAWADNYFRGKVIADGWGAATDRELKMEFAGANRDYTWQMSGNVNTDRGWYAVNHGYITMPVLPYTSTVKARGWGSQQSDTANNPTAVNAFWLAFTTISHTGTKNILGQLLAADVSVLPTHELELGGVITAIYQLTPDQGFAFADTVTFTHRYDHIAAAALESQLTVYHYDNFLGVWTDLSTLPGYSLTRDMSNNRLVLTGFSTNDDITGFFIVGTGLIIPEPASLSLLVLGGLLLGRHRRD